MNQINIFKYAAYCGILMACHPGAADDTRICEPNDAFNVHVRERLDKAIADYCRDPFHNTMFMVQTGTWKLGVNLAKNPGFEDVWGQGAHADIPEGQEWRRNVAHGWGHSPNRDGMIDTIEYAENYPGFGRRSGRIRVTGERAYYLMSIPGIKVGQKYFCRMDARLNIPDARIESKARIYMQIRWYAVKGWMHVSEAVSPDQGAANTWNSLRAFAVAPEGAISAGIFLRAENMHTGEAALFDNLEMREIIEPGE